MGFVADAVEAVVDVVGSVAEFVIDNALPIIETAALVYFTGPGGLALTGTDLMVARAVGNAAISAINGGSMASIVSAGIMPFVPGALQSVGITFNPTGFVSQAIKDTLGDSFMSTVVSSAAGSAVNAGVMAAVTGNDILEAAKYAGLTGAVGSGISRAWDVAKANSPTLTGIGQKLSDMLPDVEASKPLYKDINDMQTQLDAETKKYNDMLEKYQPYKSEYETKLSQYNGYKDQNDASSANPIATDLNDNVIPKLQSLTDELNNQADVYKNTKTTFEDYLKTNQANLDKYRPILENYMDTTKQYNALTTQSLSDYDQARLTSAIAAGDYSKAADIQAEIETFNKSVEGNPYMTVSQSSLSDPSQIDLLNKIKNAPDQATKDQLISQAKLNVYFQDMESNALANPSANQKILPSIEELLAQQKASTNPYDNLPKYPGTDTTTPTTTDTGTTNTGMTSSTSPVGNLTQTSSGSFIDTLGRMFTKQIINGVTNYVLSSAINGTPTTPTPTPPKPTISRPAQHVDISSLKPYTGTLPTGVATTTPKPSTTGGLPTTTTPATIAPLSNVTNPTQTPTQTANSGLQSVSQPQVQASNSPAKHVDISTLTPVTNNTQLANLGLNIG
jgi:hypothetical protein